MKTEGTIPAYEDCAGVPYDKATGEDLAAVRADALAKPRGGQKAAHRSAANIDRWRAENPDKVRHGKAAYGCVVAFWGMRVYYGTCQSCERLVTARKPMSYSGQDGRWPKYCPTCRSRKAQEHDDKARQRMARLRREGYEFRSEQFERLGLPQVRQGVASGLSRDKRD
jgi:hypothetical protein